MNHLSHASIYVTDFKAKYNMDIQRAYTQIDDIMTSAQGKMDNYATILEQCQRGKGHIKADTKRRDPFNDFKKVEELYYEAKVLREKSEEFFRRNKVVDLNKIANKFKEIYQKI